MKKPVLKAYGSTTTLNSVRGESKAYFYITAKETAYGTTWTEVLNTYDTTLKTTAAFVQSVHAAQVSGNPGVQLTLQKGKSGKVPVSVQYHNWISPVVINHTIKVVTKLPTLKLGKTSITLNKKFSEALQSGTVALTLDQANVDVRSITIVNMQKPGSKAYAEAQKLERIFRSSWNNDMDTGSLSYTYDGSSSYYQMPAIGTYKFQLIANLTDASTTKATILSVKVAESMPKVSLAKTTVTMNKLAAKDEVAEVKLTVGNGYELLGIKEMQENGTGSITSTDGAVTASFEQKYINGVLTSFVKVKLNKSVIASSYTLKLTPIVDLTSGGSEGVAAAKALSLKVKTISKAYTASVSVKGKLDALKRDSSEILYTLTKLNNLNDDTDWTTDYAARNSIRLSGKDADLFTVRFKELNAKKQPVFSLKLKEDGAYSTSKTYQIRLNMLIGANQIPVETKDLKVKVSQSAFAVSAVPKTQNVYQSQSRSLQMLYTLTVTKPANANIGRMVLNTKNASALLQAIDQNMLLNADGTVKLGESGIVFFQLKDTSKLVAGKTYSLILDVYAQGSAENVKPVQVKLNFKAVK